MSSSRAVAIVTGGTRGIGRSISEALAQDGFDLLVTYNTNKAAADSFVKALKAQYPHTECALVDGDLSLEHTRTKVFDTFDDTFAQRSLRVMVHSAGQYIGLTSTNAHNLSRQQAKFGDGSVLDERGIPDLSHVKYFQALYGDAFIDLCERSLQRMNQADGGSLIGISSPGCNATTTPRTGYAVNGTGKCIMEYAIRIFAMAAAEKNVNCNVVIPGFTMSDAMNTVIARQGKSADQFENEVVKQRVPMKRSAQPAEVAVVVAFLCSTKGRYITGVSLPVDGGLHLR
ncbi:Glucose/ribitol dehydrogenase [Gracilaria domingensis]|nr:Glucose/ribitol dehydrogenase [Gracilaria domingensis]